MKPEYSSTPAAADAVDLCIARPSAPVILTMQDHFSWIFDAKYVYTCMPVVRYIYVLLH